MKASYWISALSGLGLLFGLTMAGQAAGIADQIINTPSVSSWNAWGATSKLVEDKKVTAGHALRITVETKKSHPWDAAASVTTTKDVKAGDVVLVAFWARAETPAPGKDYAVVPTIALQLAQAPYTMLFSEAADIGPTWKMYYASGTVQADYAAGSINMIVQLAAEQQTVDLGPAFILDFGPGYDLNKLPHNRGHHVAAGTQHKSAEAPFAKALVALRAKLPTPGKVISAPDLQVYSFGDGQISETVADADVPGGKAVKVTQQKPAAHPWDQGASSPIQGAIHKGDVLLLAVWLRNPAESGSALIPTFGINVAAPPYSFMAKASADVPAGSWHPYYASGVATQDLPAGKAVVTMQLGAAGPAVEIGPVIALDLGPDADPAKLPK